MIDTQSDFSASFLADCAGVFGKQTADRIATLLWKNLHGYKITPECTALVADATNPNEYYLKQFLAIKMIKGLSEKSLRRYKGDVLTFFRYVTKAVPDIETNDIRYFLAIKAQESVSKVTLNNYLLSLRSFFGTLADEGHITKDPTRRIERIKEEKTVKKPFSGEDIEKLREAFKDCPRERAILEVALSTGCRVGELSNMDRDDVDGRKITVTGKGNKQRIVFLNDAAEFALKRYLSGRTDTEKALFVGRAHNSANAVGRLAHGRIEQIFRETGEKVGIDKCHPHRLRRTCATSALRNGMPIEQVSLMLGHEQIATTQIYARSEISDIEASHRKYVR